MREHPTPIPRTRLPILLIVLVAVAAAACVGHGPPPLRRATTHGYHKSKRHKRPSAESLRSPERHLRRVLGPGLEAHPASELHGSARTLQGGFQVVLNYWSTSMTVADNLVYANNAAALGMQVIWNLADYRNGSLASKLDLVRATSSHPATWGYYIGDEVRPENRGRRSPALRRHSQPDQEAAALRLAPEQSLMQPFRKLADYIGPNDYPYGPWDPPVCQTSRWSYRMGRNPVMVLQAYSWSIDFPDFQPDWPSAGEMRRMRNQATRCGQPKLLMWFCFQASRTATRARLVLAPARLGRERGHTRARAATDFAELLVPPLHRELGGDKAARGSLCRLQPGPRAHVDNADEDAVVTSLQRLDVMAA